MRGSEQPIEARVSCSAASGKPAIRGRRCGRSRASSLLIETIPIARGDAVERVEVPTPGGILEIDVGRVPLVITTP